MEFISDFEKNTNDFASKIKMSKYLEKTRKITESIKNGKKDICEIIIGENELNYSSLSEKEKINFIRNKKLELASNINLVDKDGNNPYIKKWNSKLIQTGLQKDNSLSSILYLNELYNINVVIYNSETDEYYATTLKKYDSIYCKYKDNSWELFKPEDHSKNDYKMNIEKLDGILDIDIDTILIYTSFLGPITKYKMCDLETIAKSENINLLHPNGKKKLKKDIYDQINLKHYIQDI